MKDDTFAEILQGCVRQSKMTLAGEVQKQYLTTIVYSHNDFGRKSQDQLKILLPNLIEISFNILSESGGMSSSILQALMENISQKAKKLMKLRISGVYLNYQPVVRGICELLKNNTSLQSIDFSWGSLSPRALCQISECFKYRKSTLRNIDLSYNRLNFHVESSEYQDSINFVNNFCKFLDDAVVMTHFKLSGMELGREELL
jgi:hypothetical protein